MRVLGCALLAGFMGYVWIGDMSKATWPAQLGRIISWGLQACDENKLIATVVAGVLLVSLIVSYEKLD